MQKNWKNIFFQNINYEELFKSNNKNMYMYLLKRILKEFINTENDSIKESVYSTKNDTWYIYDSNIYKIIFNESKTYHLYFSKIDGVTWRYGKDPTSEEPKFCDLGPEILDLEISVNGCPTVGGKSCRFCYKNNTNAPATNMTFDVFKKIVDSMPKCLYSIAFGITGVQTNPEFLEMLE